MLSYSLQGLWMTLLAAIGSKTVKSQTDKNAVVAFFILYGQSYTVSVKPFAASYMSKALDPILTHRKLGGASVPYLLAAEIPNAAVREKTASLGAAVNVFWAFLTNFVIPYMIASLDVKIGYIFGGISFLSVLFCFFLLPETKVGSFYFFLRLGDK